MVNIVKFMLCIFCHHKKKRQKKKVNTILKRQTDVSVSRVAYEPNKVLADVLGGNGAKSLGKFWLISFSKGSADRKCDANVKISVL